MNDRSDICAGLALNAVCEAATSESSAVIVPHPLLKTTAVRRSPAAYKETENDQQ